ncbi:MAG: FtsX-like permease family protein [Luteitalea sp.]|nr:FtsX-like permease family protein [Luteitalea sp.]
MDFRPYVREHLPPLMIAREAEIVEELAQHLDEIYGEARDAGLDHGAAFARAVGALPAAADDLARALRTASTTPPGRVADRLRAKLDEPVPPSAGAFPMFSDLLRDVRYAVRTFVREPGFTAAVVITLALGIGANTAIFTLVDAALLRTLPVAEPERLVVVQRLNPRGEGWSFSYPQFVYLREHANAVVDIFAHARIDLHLSAGDLTDAPAGLLVSDNYFSALGVQPVIGRAFAQSDDAVAVLSYRFWQTRFQGDPDIAGRAVVLNGLPFTVIGVAPPRFFGVEVGRSPDVFVPLALCDRLLPDGPGAPRLPRLNTFWLNVMARLRPDVVASQAAAHTNVVYHQGRSEQAAAMSPGLARHLRQQRIAFVRGARGTHSVGEEFGRPLLILMTVVGLVLLIACANVANLLLARAAARRREVAIRAALGAGRVHLLRQCFTESLLLSAAGGALGLLFGAWSSRALTAFLVNRVLDVTLDARVLLFTVVVSVLTGLLFGAAPALRAARTDLTPAFKGEASPNASGHRLPLGRFLVSGQVAMSLVLLIGAGLFIRTLVNLRATDAGFRGDHVLLATLDPGLTRYTPEQTNAFYAELLDRVSGVSGVRSASLANFPLLRGSYVDGLSVEKSNQSSETSLCIVGPGFFETMGIAIHRGRDFSRSDHSESAKVAIINETIARRYFSGQNPLGTHIGTVGARVEIVGVIADTKYRDLRETVPNTVYLPMNQAQSTSSQRTLHVRSVADPAGMAAAVREQVHALDKNLPVEIDLFADLVDENLAQERLIATLSGFFGGLALLLTSIGLYGVIAYSVQRRTREIGIRMSLGAGRAAVLWMVLRECLMLVGLGVATGLTASFWLSRFVTRQLYGVDPVDPLTLAAAATCLIVVATLAGYVPARRASRVEPMIALRSD